MNKKSLLANSSIRNVNFTILLIVTILSGGCSKEEKSENELLVFAAASTTNAVSELGEMYAGGDPTISVKYAFAASSTLAKQIQKGAFADIYLSANPQWMNLLESEGFIDGNTRFDLLSNRLVLVAPADSNISQIEIYPDFPLADYLGDGGRLAMGDPSHVPAGIYAKQALQNLTVWKSVETRLAPMADVRAALAMVERGEVKLGIVYATDAALSKRVRVVATFPQSTHEDILYPVAAIKNHSSKQAQQFLDFLQTKEAKSIFKKHGFELK